MWEEGSPSELAGTLSAHLKSLAHAGALVNRWKSWGIGFNFQGVLASGGRRMFASPPSSFSWRDRQEEVGDEEAPVHGLSSRHISGHQEDGMAGV